MTGATGNVGTSLLDRLATENRVTSIVALARRHPDPRLDASPAKVTWISADVVDDDLLPHLEGADVLVHLASLFQPTHRPVVTWQANAVGSARVFAAAAVAGIATGSGGLTWTEYATRHGSFDMATEPDRVFAPAGESWNSFHARVQQTLEQVARDHEGRTVVAVCHAGVIMASLRVLLGIPHPGTGAELRPANTGLTEWEHDPALDRWTLHAFNETSHLLGLELSRLLGRDTSGPPTRCATPGRFPESDRPVERCGN